MITTNSFPNLATSAPENIDIKRNSLTKEDLEGVVKKNIAANYPQNKNGGICQNIETKKVLSFV